MNESIFNDLYVELGAKFVNFFGYKCPLYFTKIFDEALSVRNSLGVFDLFHMGRIIIYKDDNFYNLQKVLSIKLNSIKSYKDKGKAKYCLILNDMGTIEDDIVLYDLIDKILIVCNACNKDKNVEFFRDLNLNFKDVSDDLLMFAVQGPSSVFALEKFFSRSFSDIYFYEYLLFDDVILSRSGYTGEDGFEIYSHKDNMNSLIKWIIENYGNVMCGLGSRDVLRVEVGLPLYGNEIDDSTNPLEANLGWAVNVKRDFERKKFLKYFEVNNSRKIPRKQEIVYSENTEVGFITSGTFSPVLQKPIGMLYISKICDNYRIKDNELNVFDSPLLNARYYRKLK
ncbi:MAG: glycine cleavage system protein T [Candidatus Calescibacterium sp.]|nr:glycine cleavage system protein T [Candidatus Calescibacterium sp.]